MESIRIWLNGGRNYNTGVKLYLQFGQDLILKRLFTEEGQTDFKTKKLRSALEDIMRSGKSDAVKVVAIHEKQTEKLQAERIMGKGWSETMDEIETALYTKWKPFFLEMMDLISRLDPIARAGLKDSTSRAEAGRIALRILDIDDLCDDIYEQRDQYLKEGKYSEANEYGEICVDIKLIPLKLANHKRYVREYKLKLKDEPGNVKYAEQLKKHQWFVEQYCKALNLPYDI